MALQGCLTVDGRRYGIIECEYEFKQAVDSMGQPSSRPAGGIVKFVMPATSDDDVFFYKWMIHKAEKHSGLFRFCVYTHNNKRSFKSVEFFNAYCIGLKDFFNDQDSKLMYSTITLSAEVIRIGALDSVMLINEWGKPGEIRDRFESRMDRIGLSDMF